MGLFGFGRKPKPEKSKDAVEQPSVEHLVGIRYDKPAPKPVVTLQSLPKPLENVTKVIDKPVYNNEQGELPMGERYLVVLDTTNRPEVKDRGLQGGLKNFYFIYATTADQAREIVLRSFARSPQILHQIQYSITVTPLSRIVPLMDERNYFWSYIPINRGQRAPGQRATPPSQQYNPANPEEVIPMDPKDIPVPITPVSQNDTPKVSEIPDEAKTPAAANPMAAMMSPTLPNGQPNPMYAMMQMMAAAMQGGQVPAAPPVQTGPIVTRGNPNDPELQANMAAVRATAVARHQHHDPSAIDDAMEEAERQAQRQVEQFKTLPREKQSASTLQKVDMNDVGIDMGKMREIMEASSLKKE